jgi:hypothetical protein
MGMAIRPVWSDTIIGYIHDVDMRRKRDSIVRKIAERKRYQGNDDPAAIL